jgi:acetyl-CoA acetyltransferase
MADVFVVGASATRLKQAGGSTAGMANLVATTALQDAGLRAGEVEAVFVGSGDVDPGQNVAALAVRLGLRRLGFRGPTSANARPGSATGHIEHISASAGEALHRAWQAVAMGIYDAVLCVGAGRATDPTAAPEAIASWPPEPALQARAAEARRYMSASGATARHLALVSAKNLRHGALSSPLRPGRLVSPEQVLATELLAWPLRRLMVASSGEGAAAIVLASGEGRQTAARSAPRVRACLLLAAPDARDTAGRAARLAYFASGLGPDDFDLVELDDVTAASELALYEDLQLAPEGQGPELIDSGFTALEGVLPVNTSGGLLSAGELPGVWGLAQVCHLAWQLRGEAGALQIPGARAGLAHSSGGAPGGDELVALTILSR